MSMRSMSTKNAACVRSEEIKIRIRDRKEKIGVVDSRGFTLIELLVVMSITSILMAILVPALGKVRRQARSIKGMNNQQQITSALNLFASDNDERYPESVATVGFDSTWVWSDPTKLIGNESRTPTLHRAMSEYLRIYIRDADAMYCPSAPHQYKYLQQAWDAGDDWDNPDTAPTTDPMGGTYCFYWNYRGFLTERNAVFRGPYGPASGGRFSKLLVTDYFGYDHWRTQGAYGSCEPFRGAGVTPETWLFSAYWSRTNPAESTPEFKLRAGYTDGHVETYSPSDVVPMRVSLSRDGTVPYAEGTGVGPGTFFLPTNALH
ncbi:MAG: type II secretion system protein [Phycisphaerae bacterium]|nr:type II secretion system protein [Phycisphaerae bacterium]